jgi:hypothetical protein
MEALGYLGGIVLIGAGLRIFMYVIKSPVEKEADDAV